MRICRVTASLTCALAVVLLAGGCTTRLKAPPSAAVLDMRAAAAGRARPAARACVDPRTLDAEATIIRFGFEDAQLDNVATLRLTQAADWARCAPAGRIVLTGEADQHGTPQQQAELITRRIAVMRQALAGSGVADSRMAIAASAKAVPTGEGAPLVLLGRGRGW